MNRENSQFGWQEIRIFLCLSIILILLFGGTASVIVWSIGKLKESPGLAVFSVIITVVIFLAITVVQLLCVGVIAEKRGLKILDQILNRLTDVNLLGNIFGLVQRYIQNKVDS